MNYRKWLINTWSLIILLSLVAVGINFHIDHYAVRLTLFSPYKTLYPAKYPDGINEHMFKPEFVFRNPGKFDSFIFGTSRVWVIDAAQIDTGSFFNMSYSEGLPVEHLAIVKAFLEKDIEIKSIVIGLDGFCFNKLASDHETQLMRIMHPDIGGPNRLKLFGIYFFRKPDLVELKGWLERLRNIRPERRFSMDSHGLVLRWKTADKIIESIGKPIFDYQLQKYEPLTYNRRATEESFTAIEELIALSAKHNFSLVFYISPIYYQLYLKNAEPLFKVKERLAQLTDFYDFSGFNTVTTDALNYYEEVHFRYRVGDMIIKRLFGAGTKDLPDDFGALVTRYNVGGHLEKQKLELAQYLQTHNLQQ
ncbi:MAG TPA: hypothetical protein ENN23_04565 [Deltaproteobacteria bacterium]|nr:hypothetical protein [Deltaproteobacteria bacterium]